MILPPHFAKLAARGQASVALVPVRSSREARRKNGTTYTAHPWAPTPGNREPLQTPVPPVTDLCPNCHVELRPSPTRRRQEGAPPWMWCWRCGRHETPTTRTQTLGEIVIHSGYVMPLGRLLEDRPEMLNLVRATGHKTRAEYADAWLRATSKTWPPKQTVLHARCEGTGIVDPDELTVCPDCDMGETTIDATPTDSETLARFRRRGRRIVHVVTFELDTSTHLRLLSPAGKPRGDDHGYTDNPSDAMSGSSDPGEAVPLRVQDEYSKDAAEKNKLLRLVHAEQRRKLPLDERLRLLEVDAKTIDITKELRVIRQRTARAEDRVRDTG